MTIYQATNTASFQNAIASAADGDTIEASGNIGNVRINGAKKSLLITARGSAMPVFSGLRVTNSAGLYFHNLHLLYTPKSADKIWSMPFAFERSQNLTLRGCRVEGLDGANGYGWGRGIYARFVDGFKFDSGNVTGFMEAVVLAESPNVSLTNSEISGVSGDAVKCGGLVGALIAANYIHDHRTDPTSGFHRDAIQLMSGANPKTVSKDLTIRGNRIDIGDGTWTQGIFLGNEVLRRGGGNLATHVWRNFLIEENLIYGRHHHAITLESARDSIIRKNTVLRPWANLTDAWNAKAALDKRAATYPAINSTGRSQNVLVEDNIACEYTGGVRQRNVTFDIKGGETYDAAYANIKTSLGGPNAWAVISGGKAAGAGVSDMAAPGVGAPVTQPAPAAPTLPPVSPQPPITPIDPVPVDPTPVDIAPVDTTPEPTPVEPVPDPTPEPVEPTPDPAVTLAYDNVFGGLLGLGGHYIWVNPDRTIVVLQPDKDPNIKVHWSKLKPKLITP